jgi:hypothetical protein
VRPDKSSATGNENASRSSSWFRFDDGISVLVHFFVSFVVHLMRVFFVWCRNFIGIFGVEEKEGKEEEKEKNEKETKETRKNQMTNFVVSICCG